MKKIKLSFLTLGVIGALSLASCDDAKKPTSSSDTTPKTVDATSTPINSTDTPVETSTPVTDPVTSTPVTDPVTSIPGTDPVTSTPTTDPNCCHEEQPVEVKRKDLSALSYDFEKEYFYDDYNTKSLADTNRQGIKTFESKDNIVFDAVTYEELINILESEGNFLILFGGSWCHNTRAAAPYINDFANQYGINKIYNFDFYLDGQNSSSHVRVTNPADESRITPGSQFNHIYGELVSRYLTNLDDYVEYTSAHETSSLTYSRITDKKTKTTEATTVAKLQVPFFFLYNKDNTVNNAGESEEGTKYPIVTGFEEMVDLDAGGVYIKENGVKKYITNEYKGRLKNVFDYIDNNNITLTNYTDADYIRTVYNTKAKTEIFADNAQINYQVLTYRQLTWLLEQEGNSIILLGGTWCGNTQASIKTFNDYAVANNVRIYNFDTKLDSGYAASNWGYSDLHIRDTNNAFVRLYTDLVEKYFTNLITLYDGKLNNYIKYTDENGEEVAVQKLQVPYLLSYDKDAVDEDDFEAPITAYYEEMLSLNSSSKTYVYSETYYPSIKSNTKNVIATYLNRVGITEVNEI